MIGKVTTKEEVEIELSISNLIKAIPNYNQYFIVQDLDNCSDKNFNTFRPMYTAECDQFDEESKDLYQLIALYGGRTLKTFAVPYDFDFLKAFKHVLKGISLLEAQGICHMDLHYGNIVRDVKGTMRIFDYGMSFVGDTVSQTYVKQFLGYYSPIYDQIPPEFTILMAIADGITIPVAISDCLTRKKIIPMAQNLLGVGMSLGEQEDSLREYIQSPGMYEMMARRPLEFFRNNWRKIDVWSVGGVFLRVLQRCFLSPHFIETQWKKDGPLVRTVLKGLLQCNPHRRLSAKEALEKLG